MLLISLATGSIAEAGGKGSIATVEMDQDSSGMLETLQPNGPTLPGSPFFASLGTNGRTCGTCHQPSDGWSISPAHIQDRFAKSQGTDPLFRLFDGANCPNADISTPAAKLSAYSLLLSKGLIRIPLSVPVNPEFSFVAVDDPYGCTNLTSATTGEISVYRRPLPSTNLPFLSTTMWDGREPSLEHQAVDATRGHAQSAVDPTPDQVAAIVKFETGLFTAQIIDDNAGKLNHAGAQGGPQALSQQEFFIGINDPIGNNPTGAPFNPDAFTIFDSWLGQGGDPHADARASIARGEKLFNETPIKIAGVAGLNDVLETPNIDGFCTTCHDSPNVGNHSVKAPLNIGLTDASRRTPDLPLFTIQCIAGPLSGQTFETTDPGRAMISGKCADIGRFKGPILRGLAARAPYFHNGFAGSLSDAVNFYDTRFGIGFSAQDKADLVAFLQAL